MDTKQMTLDILYSRDGYVSGEDIGRELGVSRAAVNKAVSSLSSEGYEIESVQNRGYRIVSGPDILSWGEIHPFYSTSAVGRRLMVFDTIDSTNNYLKANSDSLPDGTVVIADSQSAGRGRRGRSFLSPPGTGIYMSVILKPASKPLGFQNITAFIAVALCSAIESTCGMRPGIKWTNDAVMGGRKVAGILTELGAEVETGSIQYIISGIGINCNQDPGDFPEELSDIAGSIHMATGKPVKRARLAASFISELDRMYSSWPDNKPEYLGLYRKDCITVGKQVKVVGGGKERTGKAVGIDDDFGLIVEYDDGTAGHVRFGEVSVRGLYGYV
ncbi:MAG: biotin--[acetyl-CoA-carboxylase] ligase [Oscillospiraceae bacterium]|jgi:BirA family biotin operon repressor/biotin-[acetyl-CoA-carboxylase] ligase